MESEEYNLNTLKKLLLYIYPAIAIGSYGLFLVTYLQAFFNGGTVVITINSTNEMLFELILAFIILIGMIVGYGYYVKVIRDYQTLMDQRKEENTHYPKK